MNIRIKFLTMFLITSLIPLAILTTFTLAASQAAITEKTAENIRDIVALKESRTQLIIDGYINEVTLTATRPTLINLVDTFNKSRNPDIQLQINQHLASLQSTLQKPKPISVLDTQGKIIASTESSQIGKNGRLTPDTLDFLLSDNQQPSVSIKKPVVSGGKTIAEIEFIDHARELGTISQDYIGLGKTGDILFARSNPNGDLTISSSRFKSSDPHQTKLYGQLTNSQILQALEKNSGNSSGIITTTTTPFFYTLKYIPELKVALIAKVDTDEAFKTAYQLRDNVLIFSLVFILFIIMVILFFVHSITAPITHLATVAKKISGGDINQRALVLSKDEVGSLAIAFNHMLGELQEGRNTLEQKVLDRTQQLEATNKELESFSYSVSHDLRAPLRAIDGFSKILAEDYADKLDKDGERVINTIINSTRQMGTLIDDLLSFSRLSRQEVKKQPIDMTRLAHTVFDELKKINPDRKIRLQIHDLPEASADASLIRQVWANLFSNAIKFTRLRKVAIIEAGATVDKNTITYYIKDNGAGFNMAFVDKLFGVFQRLHDQKDFEGTGVGLAIIKRIVVRHGGKVWATGEIDKGATIYFTLPMTHKHKIKDKHEEL